MLRSFAAILLLWAVYGGPICGEICAELDARAALAVPPCHAPAGGDEAPEREDCCDDADAFAPYASSPAGELGALASVTATPLAPALGTRVGPSPANPPDPVIQPFARTHRPLLS